MAVATVPSIYYEFAFNADPNQNTLPAWWTDLSARVQFGWRTSRGRQYELDVNETGTWQVDLANSDGALDPGNAASPYYPNILPYRQCRIRCVLGNNLLAPDQASAGQWSPILPGTIPPQYGVTCASGYPVTIAVVGAAAYEGAQVYAVTVPSGATAPKDILDVAVRQVTAGQTYTFSIQVQVTTSGQNPTVAAAIDWIGAAGTVLSTTTGTGAGLTGASGTWTQASVTGAAPTTAVAATLRLITSTTPGANTTFRADGLQLESRSYATRWQMPWMTGVNLLPRAVATGAESLNPAVDTVSTYWYSAGTGATLSRAVNLTAAPNGQSTAVAWAAPSGSTTALALYTGVNSGDPTGPAADNVQVTAGSSYTASVYLTRTGPDATVTMTANIAWYNIGGTLLSTSTGSAATVPTASWVRASVSATAPAGAVWGRMLLKVASPSSFTGAETMYATGWQMEQAASVSTWADPGTTTFLFTGMVERWPRTWTEQDATYGTCNLTCVDAGAALAQFNLDQPFVNELLTLNPNFLYQLNEPAGATACMDSASKRLAAPVESAPTGSGSLTFGNNITSTTTGKGFLGTAGPVATFANSVLTNSETFVSLHGATVTPGPARSGAWTRLLAFRTTQAGDGVHDRTLWQASSPGGVNIFLMRQSFSSSNFINLQYVDSNVASFSASTPNGINDGNWHLLGLGVDPSTGAGTAWYDGAVIGTATGLTVPPAANLDLLGSGIYLNSGVTSYANGYTGDLALAVELPALLTSAQMSTLYASWRAASTGESTGARYARVLRWINWSGPSSVDAGATTSMGPATDLVGNSALAGLNSVTTTEGGDQFTSAAGALTFKARSAYYNVRTPQCTFGENLPMGSAGEWPAEIGSIDFDPSQLANLVKVTQYQGSVATSVDKTSQQRFFPRTYQRTVNVSNANDASDAANYLLSQYKDPHQRADNIQLHPSAMHGLFPICAQMEKGTRIRFVKRPVGAPSTTLELFTQKLDWACTPDADFTLDVQASPADLSNYWALAALHTTLSAQAAAGQKNASINALPDAAVNKLAQSLPSGYSLTFEPGTARAETVAIGTIPATSLGYSTATLVMASNLAFTHPVGSVVCEPLPTGYTDPTAWDASSVLGAAYTTVLSGGGSGTNTVTVGPLPDAAVNALGRSWNTNDTIWLSPGTANFEAVTILSVATAYAGYTTCQITLTANLAHSHAAGDWACDPLPAGVTDPTAIAASARLAY